MNVVPVLEGWQVNGTTMKIPHCILLNLAAVHPAGLFSLAVVP
jgi:hypothetical protein